MGKYLTLKQILKKPKVDLNATVTFDVEVIFMTGKVMVYHNCTFLNTNQFEIWWGNADGEWCFRRDAIYGFKTKNN